MMGTAVFNARRIDPHTVVLSVAGELDLANVRELRRHVARELKSAPRRLVIELSRLDHLDSSGLAELIEARRRADETNTRMALAFESDRLRRTIEVRGLDGLFTIAPTPERALAVLND